MWCLDVVAHLPRFDMLCIITCFSAFHGCKERLLKLPLIVNAYALFSCYMTGQLENCVNEQYTGVPNILTIVCICVGSCF